MLVQPTAQQQAAVGPAAHQVPASPPVIAQGVNTFSSPQENLVQQSLWLPYLWAACSAGLMKGLHPFDRPTLLWGRKTLLTKAGLLQPSPVAQSAMDSGKWSLTTSQQGKHAILLFFFFSLRFPKEGHLHQAMLPAGKGASAAAQQSQRQHSSRGIACRLFAVWSHLAQANIKIFCF